MSICWRASKSFVLFKSLASIIYNLDLVLKASTKSVFARPSNSVWRATFDHFVSYDSGKCTRLITMSVISFHKNLKYKERTNEKTPSFTYNKNTRPTTDERSTSTVAKPCEKNYIFTLNVCALILLSVCILF